MIDLLQRAQRGDSDAFAELFEQHKLPLWKAAVAVLGNVDDAADALQDATIKAWRAIPRFEGRSHLATWFMRILLHTSYDLLRKRKRETPYAPEGFSGEFSATLLAFDEQRAIVGGKHRPDHDVIIDVRDAIGKLSSDDRLLLTLFYVNDFPVQQVAETMNLSEGAVRTRLVRARDRFKAVYLSENEGREVAL
ncbi:MAG: RNA polymerase sigma factor [Gordonibacter sp.]|uniref:RNA polymerase sigma factor n=1 Tax=Gordonibacter sp. TaxID=1968902 RepID=UPI002FCCB32F